MQRVGLQASKHAVRALTWCVLSPASVLQVLCGGPQQQAGAHLHWQPDQDAVTDAWQLQAKLHRGRRSAGQQQDSC